MPILYRYYWRSPADFIFRVWVNVVKAQQLLHNTIAGPPKKIIMRRIVHYTSSELLWECEATVIAIAFGMKTRVSSSRSAASYSMVLALMTCLLCGCESSKNIRSETRLMSQIV